MSVAHDIFCGVEPRAQIFRRRKHVAHRTRSSVSMRPQIRVFFREWKMPGQLVLMLCRLHGIFREPNVTNDLPKAKCDNRHTQSSLFGWRLRHTETPRNRAKRVLSSGRLASTQKNAARCKGAVLRTLRLL